ncbi:MAG: urate hydroxylase PuuD [Rhodospirillales bacterium]
MGAILANLQKTVIAGFVLLVVIFVVVKAISGNWAFFDTEWIKFVLRWLHVLSGVMWIGLLYYFNFVQTPGMPKIPDEQKPAITKVIAPSALFWFRWSAMSTIFFGLILAGVSHYIVSALTLGLVQSGTPTTGPAIGIGMWLGIIMWFNVWFIIWPAQKIALGIVNGPAEAKPKAARTAMLFSRTNTLLSIPMLFCMIAGAHGGTM